MTSPSGWPSSCASTRAPRSRRRISGCHAPPPLRLRPLHGKYAPKHGRDGRRSGRGFRPLRRPTSPAIPRRKQPRSQAACPPGDRACRRHNTVHPACADESPDGQERRQADPREIDALQIFEPVEQPVGRRRVRARLELAQPHKTGHPIISRLLEQCQQLFSDRHRQPTGDPRLDASLGIDESRGTKPLDRGCRGKDSAGASALGYEATGDILVRHRHLGFSEQPFLQLARTTSGEGAEAVEPP